MNSFFSGIITAPSPTSSLTSSDTFISLVVSNAETSQAKNVDRYTRAANALNFTDYLPC